MLSPRKGGIPPHAAELVVEAHCHLDGPAMRPSLMLVYLLHAEALLIGLLPHP
jgi:hypothetical protein